MLFVTGTKRSGTSMWMQILAGAGLPWLGERFVGQWEQSIKGANPEGFYESRLRQGVFYATNPDPRTGVFLRPEATRSHVVKVFIPGLVRSDLAFIDKVVATMRPWREYVPSIQRLYAMEDAFHETLPAPEQEKARRSVARGRPRIPPEAEWWFEHYDLVRDIAVRRYPFHLTTYGRMLRDPEPEVRRVLKWLGTGDVQGALGAVRSELRTQTDKPTPPTPLATSTLAVMDELYDLCDRGKPLPASLLQGMNEEQARMIALFGKPSKDRMREDDDVGEAGE
jgi:hypothetical protein